MIMNMSPREAILLQRQTLRLMILLYFQVGLSVGVPMGGKRSGRKIPSKVTCTTVELTDLTRHNNPYLPDVRQTI